MTLVDSNVLLDIWMNDPHWAPWSLAAIAAAGDRGPVVVNTVVVAELSVRFSSEAEVTAAISSAGIKRVALPPQVAWPAARAFAVYQKRGGVRSAPLPDFFIGAHALVEKWPLLTRDPKRYRTYFPGLKLIVPRGR